MKKARKAKKRAFRTAKWRESEALKTLKGFLSLRGIFLLPFLFILLLLISPGFHIPWGQMMVGDILREPFMADVKFEVIDLEATRSARQKAQESVALVYSIDASAIEEAISKATSQFNQLFQIVSNDLFSQDEKATFIANYAPDSLSPATIDLLTQSEPFEELREESLRLLQEVMREGVVSDQALPLPPMVQIFHEDNLIQRRTEQLLKMSKAEEAIKKRCSEVYSSKPSYATALYELTNPHLKPTLRYEERMTEQKRLEAKIATPPLYKTIQKNQEIVAAGHVITPQDLEELKAHAKALSQMRDWDIYAGNALILALIFITFGIYLKRYWPAFMEEDKYLYLLGLIILLSVGIGKGLNSAHLSGYLVPVAGGTILLAILLNPMVAFVTSIIISALLAILNNYQLNIFLVSLFGCIAGILNIKRVRRRSHLLRAGLGVSVANFFFILALNLVHDTILREKAILECSFGLINGVVVGLITPGILSYLENLFGITTDFQLLEFSDLNHPLLKRLTLEASGTYHHSLMVGHLAESAAEAVGANSLLARVGSYYHDIGKVNKPSYFTENMGGTKSKHDALTPSMSSLILASHVKDGLELAEEYKLSEPIKDIVREHHGTSLISFFYQKAMEEDYHQGIQEENFRYPGPKPRSKESAIVLLADSVEAAFRSLPNPTPVRIKGLVNRIVNSKLMDNQLEECPLTLKEIHAISESFIKSLMGISHSRIEYPVSEPSPAVKEKPTLVTGKGDGDRG